MSTFQSLKLTSSKKRDKLAGMVAGVTAAAPANKEAIASSEKGHDKRT